uniref:Uncharacterized protein n=1 Tax=Clastoptera arizonana TaxID=38151 RepID=A0A1B6E435_9HEMI
MLIMATSPSAHMLSFHTLTEQSIGCFLNTVYIDKENREMVNNRKFEMCPYLCEYYLSVLCVQPTLGCAHRESWLQLRSLSESSVKLTRTFCACFLALVVMGSEVWTCDFFTGVPVTA